MKEQLNTVIFIYGTVTATALLVGQSGKCEQMKNHGGESHGKCACAIKYPSSVALHGRLCQSSLIKKALCRIWRCLETPGKATGIWKNLWSMLRDTEVWNCSNHGLGLRKRDIIIKLKSVTEHLLSVSLRRREIPNKLNIFMKLWSRLWHPGALSGTGECQHKQGWENKAEL